MPRGRDQRLPRATVLCSGTCALLPLPNTGAKSATAAGGATGGRGHGEGTPRPGPHPEGGRCWRTWPRKSPSPDGHPAPKSPPWQQELEPLTLPAQPGDGLRALQTMPQPSHAQQGTRSRTQGPGPNLCVQMAQLLQEARA